MDTPSDPIDFQSEIKRLLAATPEIPSGGAPLLPPPAESTIKAANNGVQAAADRLDGLLAAAPPSVVKGILSRLSRHLEFAAEESAEGAEAWLDFVTEQTARMNQHVVGGGEHIARASEGRLAIPVLSGKHGTAKAFAAKVVDSLPLAKGARHRESVHAMVARNIKPYVTVPEGTAKDRAAFVLNWLETGPLYAEWGLTRYPQRGYTKPPDWMAEAVDAIACRADSLINAEHSKWKITPSEIPDYIWRKAALTVFKGI